MTPVWPEVASIGMWIALAAAAVAILMVIAMLAGNDRVAEPVALGAVTLSGLALVVLVFGGVGWWSGAILAAFGIFAVVVRRRSGASI